MSSRARLPRGYFADAPTLTPAGSDAANTEPRTNAEAGGDHFAGPESGKRTTATGGPGVRDTARHMPAPAGETLRAFARHAAGVGRQAYAVAAKRIERAQKLRAARLLFGRA